jgi:hypothetical protein
VVHLDSPIGFLVWFEKQAYFTCAIRWDDNGLAFISDGSAMTLL